MELKKFDSMMYVNQPGSSPADSKKSGALSAEKVKGQNDADLFELDIKTERLETAPNGAPPMRGAVTSKSLCTPGCGNTGTYNSFCC